ncbi:hypothetical protein K492DRAFT_68650 [Lichtheimia hyalospora FSU 10163]|nr:hypothetical protein K492DRAFT_68650 [Lichtheimia hyalospora FSU 10163]
MLQYALHLAYFIAVLTVAISALLYKYQCALLYPAFFPPGSRSLVARPSKYGLPDKEEILTTRDGLRLRCYVLLQQDDDVAIQSPTLLWLHSHTGNMVSIHGESNLCGKDIQQVYPGTPSTNCSGDLFKIRIQHCHVVLSRVSKDMEWNERN